MGLVTISAIIIIAFGIQTSNEENSMGVLLILIGVLLPLFACISMYPLFALANIDENISKLTKKVDSISSNTHSFNYIGRKPYNESEQSATGNEKKTNTEHSFITRMVLSQELLDFINEKYDLDLKSDDELNIIKEKVLGINDNSNSAKVLIKKISEATSNQEIASAFALHKAANNHQC